ncbi:hypothetical protein [Spirosoma arcticum]
MEDNQLSLQSREMDAYEQLVMPENALSLTVGKAANHQRKPEFFVT